MISLSLLYDMPEHARSNFGVYFVYVQHLMLIASCSQHTLDSANGNHFADSVSAEKFSFHCHYVYHKICICGVGFSITWLCDSCFLRMKSNSQHVPFLFQAFFRPLQHAYVRFCYVYGEFDFWESLRSACDFSPSIDINNVHHFYELFEFIGKLGFYSIQKFNFYVNECASRSNK